jgi:hypothetical protein
MGPELQTRSGVCETHGMVEGVREIPRLQFPFVVYGVLRWRARHSPFLCPRCDAPVKAA